MTAFPADPDFPQLEIASDPRRMLELFRARLKPVGGKACHIEACVPFRFRCRQSTSRLVLQYTLRLLDPTTGRRWDQWVTGVVYARPGEAERLWSELQAAHPERDIPEPWRTFEPVDFLPDLQMLVEVFPYDRRLPHLAPILNGAMRGLEPLLLARLGGGGGPGDWRVEERLIEPTRYRTELGAALRYTVRARETRRARDAVVRSYVKVYRDDHGAATHALLESLCDDAGTRPYTAVRPVAYLKELRTLVLEEAAGTSVQQILLEHTDSTDQMRRVARAVAAFNQDDLGLTQVHTLADQLDDVWGAATLVQWACPEAAEVGAIAAAVARGLREVPPASIHRDLKPDHIFLSHDRVTFIDLDSAVLGDPVRDPAHLFAHLVGRVGLDALPRSAARAAATTFAEEYFRHVPAKWRARFPLHCAGALLEVARGAFKRQAPRWREQVAIAIEEARRALPV